MANLDARHGGCVPRLSELAYVATARSALGLASASAATDTIPDLEIRAMSGELPEIELQPAPVQAPGVVIEEPGQDLPTPGAKDVDLEDDDGQG